MRSDCPATVSSEIEQAYQDWKAHGSCESDIRTLGSGKWDYDIDFAAMCWQTADSRSWGAMVREVSLYDPREPIGAVPEEEHQQQSVRPLSAASSSSEVPPLTADDFGRRSEPRDPPQSQQRYTLKVRFGDDIRRLQASWPWRSNSQAKFAAIQSVVRDSLSASLDRNVDLVLQYEDDENDLCSLVPETVQDCLSLACGNVLRLKVKLGSLSPTSSPASLCDFNVLLDETITPHGLSSKQCPSGTIEDEYDCSWEVVEGPSASPVSTHS